MKVYRIKNWDSLFENNRSRTVKDLSWVCVPNRHDGENYSALIMSEHGAEIYSAWNLILQVASRCQPRGTLVRDNKKPHDPQSLSIKTRAPSRWFELAFKYLEDNTDWLEITEVTDGCHEPVSQVTGGCQATDEERKKERREGKEPHAPENSGADDVVPGTTAEWPTKSEWMEKCKMIGLPEWKATDEWLKQEAARPKWKNIGAWAFHAERVLQWWKNDGAPATPPGKRQGTESVKRHPITGRVLA